MGHRQKIASAVGCAKRLARSNAKFDRIVTMSRAGFTKEEAAKAVEMSPNGVNALLKRKGLGKRWPIPTEDL